MQDDPKSGRIDRIILLTGEAETPILSDILRAANPRVDIRAVTSAAALNAACAAPSPGTRLLSFCSPIIVPGDLLTALPGPSYNFHPGPPERPGRYPSVFALYDDARVFGITVHEMLASVDSGPIVAAEWFAVEPHYDLEALEEQTLIHLITMFRRLSPHLAVKPAPLSRQMIAWRGRKTTKADCDALAVITADMNETETARRRRACGPHILRRI
jgi:methionyl-tRNA formyltransferase